MAALNLVLCTSEARVRSNIAFAHKSTNIGTSTFSSTTGPSVYSSTCSTIVSILITCCTRTNIYSCTHGCTFIGTAVLNLVPT